MEALDVAIIGGGTAGLNARRAALAHGARVTLFDPGPLGTTCARVGCMPSKLLIAAAELAHDAQRGPEFGIRTTVEVDPVAVMQRVRRMRDLFVSRAKQGIEKLGDPIPETVRFTGPDRFEAGGVEYRARAIVLATGSEPVIPDPWRGLSDAVITTDQVFELERLPESLLVIGAGAIGLELGQAMHRLGVRVTVLDVTGRLAGLEDDHLVGVLRDSLPLDLHLRHELLSVAPTDGGVSVAFRGEDGEEHVATWERVLVAAGRRPRLSALGLDAAGLDPLPAIDPETCRLGDTHIYVAGDVTGSRMILHEAAHEGRIAGANAARHPHPVAEARKTPLALVFTDPQVARVGRRGDVTGALDFAFQSRAKVLGRDAGRLEVYADADGRLTGATVIGPDAEHLGHLLAWAVQAGLSVHDAIEMPFYHPVLEEGLEAALKDLRSRLGASAA
ncbi:MAG: dihydrolipoyl dehydrogenase [Deltaproteobacteria bacterium]|nr:MAG: dihydrolipoyl dehydrogenase [Deltaproteobacteria bacterium]